MKQRFILFVSTLVLSIVFGNSALAEKVEVGGIYYNLDTTKKTAEVTSGDNKYSGNVEIPTSISESGVKFSVTSIGSSAFYGCSGLTSVTIPNSVTSIGEGVFYGCSGLTSVTIPNSLKSIGDYAFRICSGLTSVTIPNSVTSIGEAAFFGCSGLTSVTIPNSVTSIGDYAFSYCRGLTSVTISNSVTSIGEGVFNGCSDLTSVTIPNSVMSIGDYAFFDCSGLTSVTIPNSVTNIGEFAFSGCSVLNYTIIVNDMFVFLPKTYSGHYSIPNNISKIIGGAFYNCSGLTSVTIPNSVTSIGKGVFNGCSGLTSVTIPNSVKSIGDYAFYKCSGLTSVTIPNSVTSIGYQAFSGCQNLETVIIGSSVNTINSIAFSYCNKLANVYCFSEDLQDVPIDIFSNSSITQSTLYIPESKKSDYKATKPWSDFRTITEFENSPTKVDTYANANSTVHYSTYSNNLYDTELKVPDGNYIKVFNVKVNYGSLELIERDNAQVACGEGVLVCTDAESVNVKRLSGYALTPASEAETMLKATPVNDMTITAPSGYKLFRLTYNKKSTKEGLGFYFGETGGSQLKTKIYKAYLQVPTGALGSSTNASKGFRLGDTTGIDSIEFVPEDDTEEPTYNLKGQQVDKSAKGIIVKRNKKYYSK